MAQQLPLEERAGTIIRVTASVTALTGASTDTSIYSPGVGLKALVQWVHATARFPAAPAAGDIGIASLRIQRGGSPFRLGGTRVVFADSQREQIIGYPCSLIITEDDDIRLLANAIESAISVEAFGAVHALEFAAF